MKQPQWSLNRKQITPLLCWRPSHVSSFHLEEKPKSFSATPKAPPDLTHHTPASCPLLPTTSPPLPGSSQGQPPDWAQDALCPDTSPAQVFACHNLTQNWFCSEDSLGFPSWIAASIQVPGPHPALCLCVCVIRFTYSSCFVVICHLKKQICHFYFLPLPLECKRHEVRNFCLFYLLPYPQNLKQDLVCSGRSLNISWMNKWIFGSFLFDIITIIISLCHTFLLILLPFLAKQTQTRTQQKKKKKQTLQDTNNAPSSTSWKF